MLHNNPFLMHNVLFKMAEHRSSIQDGDIDLGKTELVENIIALVCMDGKTGIDKFIEDDWGVFVPAIRYQLSIFEYDGILKKTTKDDNGLEEHIFFDRDTFTKINTRKSELWPSISSDKKSRVEAIIKALYPSKENEKDERKIKYNVRVASCLWSSGMAARGMSIKQLQESFSVCFDRRWKTTNSWLGRLKGQKSEKLEHFFPPSGPILITGRKNRLFHIRGAMQQ